MPHSSTTASVSLGDNEARAGSETQVTLTNCDREPIRIPGTIQPLGLLWVLEPETLEVLQVSENVDSIGVLSPDEVFGQPLDWVIGESQTRRVRAYLSEDGWDEPLLLRSLALFPDQKAAETLSSQGTAQSHSYRGLVHASADAVILELMPEATAEDALAQAGPLYLDLHREISRFRQAQSLSTLAQQIVSAVAGLTGFGRVMVYQFAADYSGTVVAETTQLVPTEDSFLGLKYPATDIPSQARELYLQNWLRVIPNTSYTPVPLVPERHPVHQRPLDLSATELRSVSPMHLEYLQNMGVRASMSISLIVDNKLWGLIACHHPEPKQVSFEVREACTFLGQMASLELLRQQVQVEKRYLADVRSIQRKIKQRLMRSRPSDAIASVLMQHQQELLTLVRASGGVIALGDQLTLIGETPASAQVKELLDWLVAQRQEIYYTHSLAQDFPSFTAEKDCACGLLAISIFLSRSSYHVLWFRPEQIRLVDWAGAPTKPTTIAADGSLYLTPRQSFERWKQEVREQSLPWTVHEIDAAQELRSTLLLTALEFSQVALKQAADKAQVANQAKSQFLAKMSHELRTPLNAILGFTQLIHYHETLSSEQRDRVDIINRSGEHLLSLINDVLETSRIEAGQLVLNESCFDLHQFIASINDMLTLRAVNKGLLLKIEPDPHLPQYVWGDENKLRQIIINLVGNAIKFTEQGQVILSVSCLSLLDSASLQREPLENKSAVEQVEDSDVQPTIRVQFEVSDTGPGIDPENLEAIFEPFRQSEAGRQAHEGTGLGLSISQQNARLMAGDIEVRSQLGQGATFTCQVQLGLGTADDLTPSSVQRKVVALAPDQPSPRVLVVEDVIENRKLLLSLLSTVGFDVQAANNGREAIEIWRAWRPDCIWMDLYMPEVDGYAASRQIRAEQAAIANAKPPVIIALSASAINHSRHNLISSGFDDYVSKPFQVNVIFEKMAQHLGVRYCYADQQGWTKSDGSGRSRPNIESLVADKEQMTALQSQLLAQPTDWQTAFCRAVLGAREHRISQLVQALSPGPLTHTLEICIEQLRFDVLCQLVEPLAAKVESLS